MKDINQTNDTIKEFYIADVNGDTNFQKEIITTEKLELILLFWINEYDSGKKMFAESAQTRMKNIYNSNWYKSNIHKVHCPPIQSTEEITTIVESYINKYGGKDKVVMREVGIFSHSGDDGPIVYDQEIVNYPQDINWPHQMQLLGWAQIQFNWKTEGAKCVFYGCNSGWLKEGFAKRISYLPNFYNVEVWGQSTYSYPSFYPNYRVTTLARSANTGWDVVGRNQTYMVGGNGGEGRKAIYMPGKNSVDKLDNNELKNYPSAIPMNCFKNDIDVRTTHQGYFNDHRNKTLK